MLIIEVILCLWEHVRVKFDCSPPRVPDYPQGGVCITLGKSRCKGGRRWHTSLQPPAMYRLLYDFLLPPWPLSLSFQTFTLCNKPKERKVKVSLLKDTHSLFCLCYFRRPPKGNGIDWLSYQQHLFPGNNEGAIGHKHWIQFLHTERSLSLRLMDATFLGEKVKLLCVAQGFSNKELSPRVSRLKRGGNDHLVCTTRQELCNFRQKTTSILHPLSLSLFLSPFQLKLRL